MKIPTVTLQHHHRNSLAAMMTTTTSKTHKTKETLIVKDTHTHTHAHSYIHMYYEHSRYSLSDQHHDNRFRSAVTPVFHFHNENMGQMVGALIPNTQGSLTALIGVYHEKHEEEEAENEQGSSELAMLQTRSHTHTHTASTSNNSGNGSSNNISVTLATTSLSPAIVIRQHISPYTHEKHELARGPTTTSSRD